MLWKNIKEEYKSWPVNEYGYVVSPTGLRLKIGYGANIGDGVKIGDGANIGKRLTYIVGSMHQVYLYDPKKQMIGIGCNVLTVSEWIEKYEQIGEESEYTSDQIVEYKRYIDLFAESLK